MTAKEIFEKGQVLTLEVAKTLIGKRLAITNAEYKYNQPHVREFVLEDIKSEWDLAANEPCEGYASRQEYWAKKLTNRIGDFKNRLKLVSNGTNDNIWATCEIGNGYFSEPTFFGSDADREIYYVVID